MDLKPALIELEKIIDMVLMWVEVKKPPYNEIVEPEHIINQTLMWKARKIYSSKMSYETTTEDELEERRIQFKEEIEPFVIHFSKLIYNLIK